MDKGYEKEAFSTIGFKSSVAERFRVFGKKMGKSNTLTLMLMLDFFEINEISPMERLGPSNRTLENELKKRMNAIIAIIKNIEKSQTKPTAAMLESLFTQADKEEEKLIIMKREEDLDDSKFEDWDGKDF
tara:strand:+ start:219 stop:608 length:390 start_codon:yes stop_codon:yes gene_type:complete